MNYTIKLPTLDLSMKVLKSLINRIQDHKSLILLPGMGELNNSYLLSTDGYGTKAHKSGD